MPKQPPRHKPGVQRRGDERTQRHVAARAAERTKRALPTNCAQWRAVRALVLAEHPLCACCLARGRSTLATEVDHIDGNNANNARANLQALCKSCHSTKTATENGGFGNIVQRLVGDFDAL